MFKIAQNWTIKASAIFFSLYINQSTIYFLISLWWRIFELGHWYTYILPEGRMFPTKSYRCLLGNSHSTVPDKSSRSSWVRSLEVWGRPCTTENFIRVLWNSSLTAMTISLLARMTNSCYLIDNATNNFAIYSLLWWFTTTGTCTIETCIIHYLSYLEIRLSIQIWGFNVAHSLWFTVKRLK